MIVSAHSPVRPGAGAFRPGQTVVKGQPMNSPCSGPGRRKPTARKLDAEDRRIPPRRYQLADRPRPCEEGASCGAGRQRGRGRRSVTSGGGARRWMRRPPGGNLLNKVVGDAEAGTASPDRGPGYGVIRPCLSRRGKPSPGATPFSDGPRSVWVPRFCRNPSDTTRPIPRSSDG